MIAPPAAGGKARNPQKIRENGPRTGLWAITNTLEVP